MADTTWVGGATGNETDWATGANWSTGSIPTTSAHVVIPNTTHSCALDTTRTIGSLTIQAGGTIIGGGLKLIIQSEGDASGGTEHYALKNDGIVSGNLDLDFTFAGETAADFNGTSGTFQHVRVNAASADVNQDGPATIASLVVVANSTFDAGNNTLTVEEGNISVSGTLLLNNGTVVISDTDSALSISNTGTVTCVNTNLTVNAVSLGQGTFTAPSSSGTFIITGEKDGLAFDYDGNGYVHNSGTIQIKTPASTFVDFTPNDAAHVDINNVTIDHASCVAKWTHACTIAGNLLIKQGTMEADDGDEDFTVQGSVTVGDGTGAANTAVLGNTADTAHMTFGSLTINSDGKYIATSGETSITGAGGISRAGTFTHNNGTVDFEAATTVIQDTTMTGSNAFYILKSTGTTWYRIDQDIDIERHASTGYVFWFYGNVTVTMGTDTYSSGTDNSNKCIGWSYVYGHSTSTYKLYAKNQLYPWLYDYPNVGNSSWINGSQNARMGTACLKWGNIIGDFTVQTAAGAKSIKIDGDMEFDGVTMESNNTFKLDGQRAEFGGNFRIESGAAMKSTGGGLIVADADVKILGSAEGMHDGDVNMIVEGGTHDWRNGAADGVAPWCRNVLVNGNVTHQDQLGGSSGNHNYNPESVIVGNGKLTQSGGHAYLKDLTIATAGNLEMTQSTQKVLDINGDFNIAGGLIGLSALSFPDGGNSPTGAGNALDVPYDLVNLTGDATIEFWMYADANTNNNARGIINGYKASVANRWQLYQSVGNEIIFYSHDNNKSITVTCPTGKWITLL